MVSIVTVQAMGRYMSTAPEAMELLVSIIPIGDQAKQLEQILRILNTTKSPHRTMSGRKHGHRKRPSGLSYYETDQPRPGYGYAPQSSRRLSPREEERLRLEERERTQVEDPPEEYSLVIGGRTYITTPDTRAEGESYHPQRRYPEEPWDPNLRYAPPAPVCSPGNQTDTSDVETIQAIR